MRASVDVFAAKRLEGALVYRRHGLRSDYGSKLFVSNVLREHRAPLERSVHFLALVGGELFARDYPGSHIGLLLR